MKNFDVIVGDCRAELRKLPAACVHCVVTSIPYWGLRDYGIEPSTWGGDPACAHEWGDEIRAEVGRTDGGRDLGGGGNYKSEGPHRSVTSSAFCRCGAWRGAFGLEPDYRLYVEHCVEVFREVSRVLRDDGTCWLNIGDCYATGAGAANLPGGTAPSEDGRTVDWGYRTRAAVPTAMTRGHNGFGTSGLINGGAYQEEAPRPRGRPPQGATSWAGYRGARNGTAAGKQEYSGIGPMTQPNRMPQPGLKTKDRAMMPHRVAIALQDDGWYVRDEVVWNKPNPMPESTEDRTTKSHEFVFLLTKRPTYYFDNVAIAEESGYVGFKNAADFDGKAGESPRGDTGPTTFRGRNRAAGNKERKPPAERGAPAGTGNNQAGSVPWAGATRNKRSVWTIATTPFPEAHFATFPPALVEPCVLAGTSERGCCPSCGAGWERVTAEVDTGRTQKMPDGMATYAGSHTAIHRDGREAGEGGNPVMAKVTLGFYPGCGCYGVEELAPYPEKPSRASIADEGAYKRAMAAWREACEPVTASRRAACEDALALPVEPALVLDPFGGAGTTALVARRLGRAALLVELNLKYARLARARVEADGMTKESAAAHMARAAGRVQDVEDLPLFRGA